MITLLYSWIINQCVDFYLIYFKEGYKSYQENASNRLFSADENGATVGEEDPLLKEMLEPWVSSATMSLEEYELM